MNEITKHKEKVAENIIKSFDCDIEKAFPIGTIRNWGGVDYKKVGDNEWIKVENGKSVANSTILKRLKEDVNDLKDKRDIVTIQEKEKRAREVGNPTESMKFRVLWDSKFSKEIGYVNKVREIDDKIKDILDEISELSITVKKPIRVKKEITINDKLFQNLGLHVLRGFGILAVKGDDGKFIERWLSAKEALGEVVNSSNYFLFTHAVFDEIIQDEWKMDENKVHRKFVDAVAEFNKMKESGKYEYTHSPKSDSEYLVDEKNGVVYRIANHWGKCASCDWYIRFKGEKDGRAAKGGYILAKCNFSDFLRKEGLSAAFENPEYVKANINAVENCLKKIKHHLDSGVVFSKGAKNELINSWNVCKNSMSRVSESMKDSVKRLQDEYEKLFEE